jgi:T-complex protein 1 subunit theta
MGLHPSEILIGYEKGAKKALEILEELPTHRLENLKDLNELKQAIKTSIASKQFGLEDFLGGLIANACLYAMP